MIFHVDANAFYCSCEQLFRPDLRGRPIAVLSNNDWFIISLNQECKDLGFKRGDPISSSRALIEKNGVAVFSSNYTLYADISARLNLFYENYSPEIEIYSIDETFLYFPYWPDTDYTVIGHDLLKKARRNIGIPVSVGIAPNKTLAKLCNKLAKKRGGVCEWQKLDQEETLKKYPVADVWGIGKAKTEFLHNIGIFSAFDLKNLPLPDAKKHLTINGFNTVQELNGIEAIEKSESTQREMILCSRSFKGDVKRIEEIISALSVFTQEAVKRLRDENSVCNYVSVYLKSDPYQGNKKPYKGSSFVKMYTPTDYIIDIEKAALTILNQLFREGYIYRKVGIMLSGLESKKGRQKELYSNVTDQEKKEKIMAVYDKINNKYGRGTIRLAVSNICGKSDEWKTRRDFLSPEYTTKLKDIPKVY